MLQSCEELTSFMNCHACSYFSAASRYAAKAQSDSLATVNDDSQSRTLFLHEDETEVFPGLGGGLVVVERLLAEVAGHFELALRDVLVREVQPRALELGRVVRVERQLRDNPAPHNTHTQHTRE